MVIVPSNSEDTLDERFNFIMTQYVRRHASMTSEEKAVLWRKRCAMLRARVAGSIWQGEGLWQNP